MVLVSNLATMQPPATRASRHPLRNGVLDDRDYIHLSSRSTPATTSPPPPPPSSPSSSSSSKMLSSSFSPPSSSTQLPQHSVNLVNGFHHHKNPPPIPGGPGSYRSSSLARIITNGNIHKTCNGINASTHNKRNDNVNAASSSFSSSSSSSSPHRQQNLRTSSAIIQTHHGFTTNQHDNQNHSSQNKTNNHHSSQRSVGVNDVQQNGPPAQHRNFTQDASIDSKKNQRDSITSLNFNHENLFYQPSIHNEAVENDLHIDADRHHHRNSHHNPHPQHQQRPRSYHEQQQEHNHHHVPHQHQHDHHHQSPPTPHSNRHSYASNNSSSSLLLHSSSSSSLLSSSYRSGDHHHLSSSHPVRSSVPSGLQLQHTFPPSSSSSSTLSSSKSSSTKTPFHSSTLPRPSSHLPSSSKSSSPSSSLSSSTNRRISRHDNTSTLTRPSAQQEHGHPADSSVIARRGDPSVPHAHNTPMTSAVNHRDTATHANNPSSLRSNDNNNDNKTHHDTPYHYRPSSLIDVGQNNNNTSPKVNEKNGRERTIDFAMKSGYFNQNGRVNKFKPENNSKPDAHATTSPQSHNTLDRSGSTKSNKSQTGPKHSTTMAESPPNSSGLSAVLDIPMSSIVSADSWSPSYIKMDFFMRNGDSSSSSPSPTNSSSPGSSSGLPTASTTSSNNNHLWKSALRNGYKSHILSNSFDSSTASTQSSSRIVENGYHRSHDSNSSQEENISRSDNSSTSSLSLGRHEHHHQQLQQSEEQQMMMSTHHARLLNVSRSTVDLRNSSSSSTSPSDANRIPASITPIFDSVCGTLPQKVKTQFIRRSVSHEPREADVKVPVIRAASDGEIESEYVTLDEAYIPLNNSGLCRVNEIIHVDESSKPSHESLTVLPQQSLSTTAMTTNKQKQPNAKERTRDCVVKTVTAEKNKNIKRIHNPVFTNEDSNIKLESSNSMTQSLPSDTNTTTPSTTTTNLVKVKRSMRQNLLKMNSFPDSLRRQIKSKNSAGNLCTVVENDVSASSASSVSSSSLSFSSNPVTNHNNALSESFFTLPRNRSSYSVDARASPSSTNSVDSHRGTTGQQQQQQQQQHTVNNSDSSRSQTMHLPLHATPSPNPPVRMPKSILIRSKSLPDLQQAVEDDAEQLKNGNGSKNNSNDNNNFYSDDEDGDEYGFLSYPISFSLSSPMCPPPPSSVMQKAKSPSPTSRILPKRWRTTKAKAVPGVTPCAAMWTPGPLGSCMWSSMSGRKVVLRPVSILSLSESERIALQKVAYSKLQEMALDCPVVIPKDATDVRRSKKSALSLKRRSKSATHSSNASNGKDASGLVFGIPITKCIKNDREVEKKKWKLAAAAAAAAATSASSSSTTAAAATSNSNYNNNCSNIPTTTTTAAASAASASSTASPSVARIRTDWTTVQNSTTPRSVRKSSSSSQGSLDKSGSAHNGLLGAPRQDTLTVPSYKRAASSDSLSESESSRNTSSSLIDALSLSASFAPSRLQGAIMADSSALHASNQGELQVPRLVNTCFKHIQTFGLQTLGIFRVGCSKKRVKELREEFDSGKDVELVDDHHPHDVGALLKEYFRDLPEPLLTRELYMPFLHAKRMKNQHKRSAAMQLLISMLPVANRDTLWSLLQFLAVVSQHAGDSLSEKGEKLPGNKMDSHNLATLFGPNILHRTRSSDSHHHPKDHGSLDSAESVEESKEVIEVVKEMIECNHELYEISGSLRDDVLRLIVESDQEMADRILKQLANQNQIEADPESMCSVFEDSTGSPVLSHAMNSDADFFAYAKTRQTSSASQRPLRVTKSVEDNLDSPVSKSRATHFSDSYATSSTHDLKIPPSNTHPCIHQDMITGYHSPVPPRIPILQLPHESSPDPATTAAAAPTAEVVLRNRMDLNLSSGERPYSESFSQNLSIPRPIYLRESSNSSVSSCLSSSQNSHRDSDGNNLSGYWALPTPPASRGASPKPLIRSSSSSSTLIPSPSPAKLGHSHSEDYNNSSCDSTNNKPQSGSSHEWEQERWRHWEMMASEKRNAEVEQETLV